MTHSLRPRTAPAWLPRALLAACALASAAALAQKIDDVPPAVQNGVAPNFMFMIDNSGSMSNIVPAAPYVATTTYQASCTGSNVTIVPAGTSVDINVVNGAPRIVVSGTGTRPHVSARANSTVSAFCFNSTATYSGRLLADIGTASSRSPGNYLDSDYSGNFLNWYFGNFDGAVSGWTDRKLVTSGAVETRIEIARRSARAAVDSLPLTTVVGRPTVRVGLSTYASGGGALLAPLADLTATSRTTLETKIAALASTGNTPLATTFADLAGYFSTGYNGNVQPARLAAPVNIGTLLTISGTDNPTARGACPTGAPISCRSTSAAVAQQPITAWCQRSSIFAMTDGRPNGDRGFDRNSLIRDYDGDCSGPLASNCSAAGFDQKKNRTYEASGSDYMDDVAMLLFDTDWRPDLKPASGAKTVKNNIATYVIGFADPAVQNDPLLLNTARQGGGKFIAATDGPTLADAFRDVMTDALAKDAAAAAVAVTNAQITNGGVGYASSYSSGTWFGDLEAYSLDVTTGLQNGPTLWHARDQLNKQSAASRKIASYNGSAGVAFTTSNGSAFRLRSATLSDDLINYTRGDKSLETTTFRPRTWLLGDIINAEPVVVNYSNTNPVVYQAGNDGMLHAFDGRVNVAQGGQELWAYVPSLIHGKLAGRANPVFQHEFLVDGTPATALITGFAGLDRILVGGLGKGGAGYYALNITSGAAATEADAVAKVLWEFKPTNMGYSFGTPLIVNTARGWRVVVASGLRNDGATDGAGGDGRGHVWVLNPDTGSVDREFITPPGVGSASAGAGLTYLAAPSNLSAGSTIRYVYGGDVLGNMWRIDLNAAPLSNLVRVATVTAPDGSAQPITSAPVVSPYLGSATKFFVYFGTGQYFSVDDVPGTSTPDAFANQVETIYGAVDDTSVASPSQPNIRNASNFCSSSGGNGDFACQTITANADGTFTTSHNTVDLTRKRGFYVDIPISGGRVNTQPSLTAGGTLVMVVNDPSNVICNPGGSSYLIQLAALTGGAIPTTFGGNEYFQSVFGLGDALSSRSVIVTTGTGLRALLRESNKTTDSQKLNETANNAPGFRRIYMRPLN